MLALAACATMNETPNVDKDYVLSEASGNGLAIGTLISSGDLAEYRIYYRKAGGGEEGYFQLKSDDPSLDGALFVAGLSPGDYEIDRWYIGLGGSTWIVPAAPFSIRFHVSAGKAVYLGSFRFAGKVACTNESERDLKLLESLYPRLSGIEIAMNVEKGAPYSNLGKGYKVKRSANDF